MTVGELIEELKKYDPSYDVEVRDDLGRSGGEHWTDATTVSLSHGRFFPDLKTVRIS